MAGCNTQMEIHQLPGTTQGSRFPKALGTDFVLLDERKIEDLIVSTIQMSQHIYFYGPDNVVDGNWSSFFGWEPTSLFAELSTLNLKALQQTLKLKTRKLLFIADEADKKIEMQTFFLTIQKQLESYRSKINNLPADMPIKEYFLSFYSRVKILIDFITNQIETSSQIHQLFQDHLFTRQIRNLFGMLGELKSKATASFQEHINSYPKHSPQYTLFLTFLKLFSEAQQAANQFTSRHLDFYYKKVLHLEAEAARPDYVHGIVQPQKNVAPFLLEKETVLIADKTEDGKTKYYATTADLAVNLATIEKVYGGFIDKSLPPKKYYFKDFTDVITKGESWKPFAPHSPSQNIGIAVASPLLFLKGGDRKIKLTFTGGTSINLLKTYFHFYLSGEKEWIEVNAQTSGNQIVITLPVDESPIVPFNPEIHDGPMLSTTFPVLKMTSKNGRIINVNFSAITLQVEVENYKDFSLFSDFGEIDHSKKFDAFGPVPRKDSSIYFSSNEFFQKKNAVGTFEVIMDDESWNLFSHSELAILKDGNWEDDAIDYREFNNITENLKNYVYDENPIYTNKSVNGFARIKFHEHEFMSGDGKTTSYLEAFIAGAKSETSTNLPYLPVITSFNFSYTAGSAGNPLNTFYLYPEGYEEKAVKKPLPPLENEGELFIGIQNIQAGQPISLLVQVEEGTANPTLEPAEVYWKYLDPTNQWTDFEQNIGDETNGLTQSGIVYLKVPEDFQFGEQTIFPGNNFWIKVAVPERTDAVCNLIGLHLQAFKAVLTDYGDAGVVFTKHLDPKKITKLLRPKNEIKKIEQPYASFGGRETDTPENFYKRTSERLRHRARAISKWDYETLVLDEFPNVYRIKCLPHFQVKNDKINNTSAGSVTLVPVASSSNENLPLSWRPLVDLNTMKNIKTFLQAHATPHAKIEVIPPNLEHIVFSFKIKYHVSLNSDTRLYAENLQQIINAYLSPWAFEDPQNVQFQGEIYTSKIIQIIESQPYVDYIFNFKTKHYDADKSPASVSFSSRDKIVPLTDYSLFLPGVHTIIELQNVCCT